MNSRLRFSIAAFLATVAIALWFYFKRDARDELAVLRTVRQSTLYARIDGIVRDQRLICTEIELADPSLYMQAHPPTADLVARATIDAVRRASG